MDKSIRAFNWCVYYFTGEISFNEVCYFILNEFTNANVIVIERNKHIIRIRLPLSCTYATITEKLEKCYYQTLVDIESEEEVKIPVSSRTDIAQSH